MFSAFALTPEQAATEAANTIRTVVMPAAQGGIMTKEQISDFFTKNVYARADQINIAGNVTIEDGIFVRITSDSLGGGSLEYFTADKIVGGLRAIQKDHLQTARAMMLDDSSQMNTNPLVKQHSDDYAITTNDRNLWPLDWFNEELKTKISKK